MGSYLVFHLDSSPVYTVEGFVMAKHKTIEVMDNLTIDEVYREGFIRVLKYGLAHVPWLDEKLREELNKWIKEEEDKISRFEGVITEPVEEEEFDSGYAAPFGGED